MATECTSPEEDDDGFYVSAEFEPPAGEVWRNDEATKQAIWKQSLDVVSDAAATWAGSGVAEDTARDVIESGSILAAIPRESPLSPQDHANLMITALRARKWQSLVVTIVGPHGYSQAIVL